MWLSYYSAHTHRCDGVQLGRTEDPTRKSRVVSDVSEETRRVFTGVARPGPPPLVPSLLVSRVPYFDRTAISPLPVHTKPRK